MPIPKQPTTPPMPKCVPPKDAWVRYDKAHLPYLKKDEFYLVTVRVLINVSSLLYDYGVAIAMYDTYHNCWVYDDSSPIREEVIAWMPLPEPYIPKED